MPKLDGYEVTRQVRVKHNLPIIFLSAKTSDFDKITGLVMGADDYMIKPFNPMELLARVNSQLRRSLQFSQPPGAHLTSVLELGGLIISLTSTPLRCMEKRLTLRRRNSTSSICWRATRSRCSVQRAYFSRYGARRTMRAGIQ